MSVPYDVCEQQRWKRKLSLGNIAHGIPAPPASKIIYPYLPVESFRVLLSKGDIALRQFLIH